MVLLRIETRIHSSEFHALILLCVDGDAHVRGGSPDDRHGGLDVAPTVEGRKLGLRDLLELCGGDAADLVLGGCARTALDARRLLQEDGSERWTDGRRGRSLARVDGE